MCNCNRLKRSPTTFSCVSTFSLPRPFLKPFLGSRHLFSRPFLATFSKPYETLQNISNLTKPSQTFQNLSKHSQTFQNLSKPFKTFQNLSKPFLSKIFLPNKLQYKNHAGRPGAALLSHMTTPSSVVFLAAGVFWLPSCHVSLGEGVEFLSDCSGQVEVRVTVYIEIVPRPHHNPLSVLAPRGVTLLVLYDPVLTTVAWHDIFDFAQRVHCAHSPRVSRHERES